MAFFQGGGQESMMPGAQYHGAADPLYSNSGAGLQTFNDPGATDNVDSDAPVGAIPSVTYRTDDGRLVDRYIVPERHAVPDTRVIYSQTTVDEPRVIMEPKTVTVQTPKTIMEEVEFVVEQPRTVLDEKTIPVPKIIHEEEVINVPVPKAVQVPVQRMVPRTVMVPITTYVTQYVEEIEQRSIRVPKTVMEDKSVTVPRQVLYPTKVKGNRPKVIMEDRQITVQEPKTVTVPRVVPVAQTIQGQRIVETPRVVEYERPTILPGRYLRSYRAPGVYPSGYFATPSPEPQEQSPPMMPQQAPPGDFGGFGGVPNKGTQV